MGLCSVQSGFQAARATLGVSRTGRWLLASLADRFTGIEFDFPLLLRLEECLDCFHRFVCWAWVRAAFDGLEHLWQAAARYDGSFDGGTSLHLLF